MTNKEKYGNEIIELATRTALFGLKKWRTCTLRRN